MTSEEAQRLFDGAVAEIGYVMNLSEVSDLQTAAGVVRGAVNDALGARPDAVLGSTAPAAVLEAVTYGRPVEDQTAAS